MFTVKNVSKHENGNVSFQLAYTISGTEKTIEVSNQPQEQGYLIYLLNSFTYLKFIVDEIHTCIHGIKGHYFWPFKAPCFENDNRWKEAFYKFQGLRSELLEHWNAPGSYCKILKNNENLLKDLIPTHCDLNRSIIKELVEDATSLPDRILKNQEKYFTLTEKEYASN